MREITRNPVNHPFYDHVNGLEMEEGNVETRWYVSKHLIIKEVI